MSFKQNITTVWKAASLTMLGICKSRSSMCIAMSSKFKKFKKFLQVKEKMSFLLSSWLVLKNTVRNSVMKNLERFGEAFL